MRGNFRSLFLILRHTKAPTPRQLLEEIGSSIPELTVRRISSHLKVCIHILVSNN
jgi:hypothetical protein